MTIPAANTQPAATASRARSLFKKHLEPTDFLDSECRLTEWLTFPRKPSEVHCASAYRVWVCRVGRHWFQRHEWQYDDRNSTQLDDWLYTRLTGFKPCTRLATDEEIADAYSLKHGGGAQ